MNETRILDLVDLCYQALDCADTWQHFVAEACDMFQADACDFTVEDYNSGVATALGSVGFDPGFRVDYDIDFLGENGWIEQLKNLPLGRAFENQMEPEDFENSAYYNEWVRPQGFRHAIGALLDNSGARAIHFGLLRLRDRDMFERDDARLIDRVLPHMRRVVDLRGRLARIGAAEAAMQHLVESLQMPALLLDEDARLVEANTAAQEFLRAEEEMRVRRGVLRFRDREAELALGHALATAAHIELLAESPQRCEIVLRRRDLASPAMIIDVIPLRFGSSHGAQGPLSLVIITDPAASVDDTSAVLSQIWGLTPTEAKLSLALANGESLAAFSARLNMSIGTARWHLKNAEGKLGVSSIAALTAMVQGALRRP
ncbi:helix-turn-helix transcriptional regulator [Marimonas lutisalis]|uniref:helix-turn-helix transcriptional regulator n=1 Tax=Marimonas lutisalis TaxID=2545756 RepID=UPI0013757501|nr:LuxR C-terminal-related transcriptional regulator [Marimonas lutisalis]